jgi:hypothetical protein
MRHVVIAILAGAALAVGPRSASVAEGYVGQETRDIKALSADDVADLLNGRGMGLAKAAELNHYPGPLHVLQFADQLALTPDQRRAVEASFQRMSDAAKPLGATLVERERALDRGFADQRMTAPELTAATAEIGALQGQLRAAHLGAHLEMRAILSADQIARYDALRGYTGAPPPPAAPGGHPHRHGG